jgi:hypothetical protein
MLSVKKPKMVRGKYILISRAIAKANKGCNREGERSACHPEYNEGSDLFWIERGESHRSIYPEREMEILHFVQNDRAKSAG